MLIELKGKFLKEIYNDDIIYHYTKASTAIDYILHKNQLRFNKASDSFDPIESKKADRRFISLREMSKKIKANRFYEDADEVKKWVENLETSFCQICFCKNKSGSNFASPHYHTTILKNLELFGFTKMRMWDQYADRYSGVCIAFSKEKIIELNNKKFDLLEGDVSYFPFIKLLTKKVGNIQVGDLEGVGKEQYVEKLKKKLKESFFCKHIDYSGENEYRIGTLFDKDKCSIEQIRGDLVLDKSMMLDITDCVKAIIVSSFANEKQKKELLVFANKLGVKLVEINWQYDSIKLFDVQENIDCFNEIKNKSHK